MLSHDQADKQAELDVVASMRNMLQDMQAYLTQSCESSAASLKANLTQAPTLYDISGSINAVLLAWQEWNSGPGKTTTAQRVLEIKAHKHMSTGRHNVHSHKQNRHLPQLIEALIGTGATPVQAVSLLARIADHFQLMLDHMREGVRLLSGKTAKGNSDGLTAETIVALGQFKAALGWAYAQVISMAAKETCKVIKVSCMSSTLLWELQLQTAARSTSGYLGSHQPPAWGSHQTAQQEHTL